MRRAALFAAAALFFAAGCGGDERLSPAPVDTPEAPVDAGPGDDAAAPRRHVLQRNPFGNVAEADNLLWDGDFEWSSPFADQYGWLKGPPFSYNFDSIRIGPVCRSGIKCAAVPKSKAIIGIGVGAAGSNLDASFWARLPGAAACEGIDAMLFNLVTGADPDTPLVAEEPAPDAAGWCHYRVVADERAGKTYLYIRNRSEGEMILDDAVLKAAPKTLAITVPPRPPTAEQVAALAAAAADLKGLQGPHDPPPNAARRALEAWKRP